MEIPRCASRGGQVEGGGGGGGRAAMGLGWMDGGEGNKLCEGVVEARDMER